MRVTIDNPTYRSKAVKISGDLLVIKPGGSADAAVQWSDADRARYEGAGLIITHAKPGRPKKEVSNADPTTA